MNLTDILTLSIFINNPKLAYATIGIILFFILVIIIYAYSSSKNKQSS